MDSVGIRWVRTREDHYVARMARYCFFFRVCYFSYIHAHIQFHLILDFPLHRSRPLSIRLPFLGIRVRSPLRLFLVRLASAYMFVPLLPYIFSCHELDGFRLLHISFLGNWSLECLLDISDYPESASITNTSMLDIHFYLSPNSTLIWKAHRTSLQSQGVTAFSVSSVSYPCRYYVLRIWCGNVSKNPEMI